MSVSEKLKVLEARTQRAPWSLNVEEVGVKLALALPQIVAVVEAAEQLSITYTWSDEAYDYGDPPTEVTEPSLRAALSALEEALS